MKLTMDKRAIQPFNDWWNRIAREGDPIRRPGLTQEAFAEGFKAGMQRGVDEAIEILKKG